MLNEVVRTHGLDIERIRNEVQSRSCEQINRYINTVKASKTKSSLTVPHDVRAILHTQKDKKSGYWTSAEKISFFSAIRQHGKNYDEIAKMIHTRDRAQIMDFTHRLKKQLLKKPSDKADILQILQSS